MKFDGHVEVSGIRRVVFGERPVKGRPGRQSIYERDESNSQIWRKVSDPDKCISDEKMTRRIKGAAYNKRSRVVVNGDTINVMKPRPVERVIPKEPCDICGGSGAEHYVGGPIRMLCPRCKIIISKYMEKKRQSDAFFQVVRSTRDLRDLLQHN